MLRAFYNAQGKIRGAGGGGRGSQQGNGGGGTANNWDPAKKGTNITLSLANAKATSTSGSPVGYTVLSITGHPNTGNWYAEITVNSNASSQFIGVGKSTADLAQYPGRDAANTTWAYYSSNGQKYNQNFNQAYGTSYTAGDVIGVQLNAGALIFWKNGVSQGTAYTLGAGTYYVAWGPDTNPSANNAATINTTGGFSNLPSGASPWG